MSFLATATAAAYEYRAGSELPLYALKRRKAQKQRGFRAKSTYGHCIKDKVLIDPPYNTGHDFIYPDSYVMDDDEFYNAIGYFNEDGSINYSRENVETSGKYHSDWCSLIYSRLTVAKNLLAKDGIIFVSSADNELDNLIKTNIHIDSDMNKVFCENFDDIIA